MLKLLRRNSGWRTPVKFAARVAQQRLGANRPLFATFFVTKRCNVRCDGCVYYVNQDDLVPKEEETTERALFVLDRLADEGVPIVAIVGGEPFLRKDLGEILRHGHRRGLSLSLITNAMRLHDDGVEAAEVTCDSVVFSPHPPSELYGTPQRTAQRYAEAWEGLRELRRRLTRPELVCAITIGKHTAPVLDEIIAEAVEIGADAIKYQPNFFPDQFPSREALAEVGEVLTKWTARLPERFTDSALFLDDLPTWFGARPRIGCTSNRRYNIGVFLDGSVSACCAAHVKIGNLLETPISDMLHHQPELKPDCYGCHRVDVRKAMDLCGDAG